MEKMGVLVGNLVEAKTKHGPKTSWHLGRTRNQPKKLSTNNILKRFTKREQKREVSGTWNKVDRSWTSYHGLHEVPRFPNPQKNVPKY